MCLYIVFNRECICSACGSRRWSDILWCNITQHVQHAASLYTVDRCPGAALASSKMSDLDLFLRSHASEVGHLWLTISMYIMHMNSVTDNCKKFMGARVWSPIIRCWSPGLHILWNSLTWILAHSAMIKNCYLSTMWKIWRYLLVCQGTHHSWWYLS